MNFLLLGFPGEPAVKNPPAMQETQEMWVQSQGWEDPLEKGMATHSFSCRENPYSPSDCKESDMTEVTELSMALILEAGSNL